MIKLLFTFLIIATSFAQNLDNEILALHLESGRRFNNFENKQQVVERLVKKAQAIAVKLNIQTKIIRMDGYSALEFLPSGNHAVNQEVKNTKSRYGNILIVYSPHIYKLSGGINAYFNPNGSTIGVPALFLQSVNNSSYLHEKLHAHTRYKMIQGRDDEFSGFCKINSNKIGSISPTNGLGYSRLFSFDEFLASFSGAYYDAVLLKSRLESQGLREFNRNEFNEQTLGSIDQSLESTNDTIEHLRHVLELMLDSRDYEEKKVSLAIGSRKKSVNALHFYLPSYEREFQGGRSYYKETPRGTLCQMETLNPDQLYHRVKRILSLLDRLHPQVQQAQNLVGKAMGTYPRLDQTDLPRLHNAIEKIFRDNRKLFQLN